MSPLLILVLLIPSLAFAKEETLSIQTSNDKSIHYNRHILQTTVSSITPIGFFEFETSKENGQGKIFSEYNIGGFGQVANNPWKKFTARSHGLKYGIKHQFSNGTLTAGIGAKKYQGTTNCKVDGCKDIESSGWGIKTGFTTLADNTIMLDYKKQWSTPTQYHPFSQVPFPVVQNATLKNNDIDINGNYKQLLYTLHYQFGTKRDTYSLLVPEVNQSFRNIAVSIAPEIQLFGHPMNIGPKLCSGSTEGDLAKLELSGCWGINLFTVINDADIALEFNKDKRNGDTAYAEYAMTETVQKRRVDLEIKSEKWALSFFSLNSKHRGDFNLFSPSLIFIAGGNAHINHKTTQEYGLKLTTFINEQLSLTTAITTFDIKGQFYTNPKIDDSGQKIDFGLLYQF